MTVLKLHLAPNPVLGRKAAPVPSVTPSIKTLARDMIETMYAAGGIGLAANQVGRPERLAVIQTQDMAAPLALVNPQITSRQGTREVPEGCLSIPDRQELVTRARTIEVSARDLGGNQIQIKAQGLLAQVIEHETDHLEGHLYTEHLVSSLGQRLADQPAGDSK